MRLTFKEVDELKNFVDAIRDMEECNIINNAENRLDIERNGDEFKITVAYQPYSDGKDVKAVKECLVERLKERDRLVSKTEENERMIRMYILKGTVKDRYVGEYICEERDIVQAVMANNKEEAIKKFKSYWDEQGACGYEIWNAFVYETIE